MERQAGRDGIDSGASKKRTAAAIDQPKKRLANSSKRARLTSEESRELFFTSQPDYDAAADDVDDATDDDDDAAAANTDDHIILAPINNENKIFLFKNVPNKENLDEHIADFFTIQFDPVSKHCGIQWMDDYFKQIEVAKCLDFLHHFCLIASHPPSVCPALSAFVYDYYQNVGRVIVNSMIDAAMLVAFHFFYIFMTLNAPKSWIVIDLPPGVGKSYEMMRLFYLVTAYYRVIMHDYEERTLISTPTARAQNVFPGGIARTLHSQMNLPIRTSSKFSAGNFFSYQQSIARSFESAKVRARIAIAQVYSFFFLFENVCVCNPFFLVFYF